MTTIRPIQIVTGAPEAETIQSSMIRVRTVPSCGAKITELRSLSSGRDWLWTNPRQLLRQGKPFASYVAEFDSGGWDELFPTVEPIAAGIPVGGWGGGGLTDHGELWHRRWTTERSGALALDQSVVSETPPYEFVRSLSLDRLHPVMRLNYSVQNHGEAALPYLWAAHPLFRCDVGMSIDIHPRTPVMKAFRCDPGGAGPLRCRTWGQVVDRFGFLDRASGWTDDDRSSGVTLKVFVRLGGSQAIGLHDHRTRERLTIADPNSTVGYAALWLNFGGWSGDGNKAYHNIGIEATTAAADSPLDGDSVLEPGRGREWSIAVSFER